mgnify:CR=1 FL=1
MKPIIETAAVEGWHIVKNFRLGDTVTEVLRDVSLRVMPGEFVSIMGPSGSGKSTLLYILGGLDTPTGGRVLLNGTDISSFGDEKMSGLRRRSIGFVFQFYNLIPNLNVEENITLPLLLDNRSVNTQQLDSMVEALGLKKRLQHLPSQLSGGQQQRVSIGRALMASPAIVLADEPTGNLDRANSREIIDLLKRLHDELHQTLIIITHDEGIALQADRILKIEDGHIVRDEVIRR